MPRDANQGDAQLQSPTSANSYERIVSLHDEVFGVRHAIRIRPQHGRRRADWMTRTGRERGTLLACRWVNLPVSKSLGPASDEEIMMSNTPQDRAKVAGGQDHEVRYEAGKIGTSKTEVKDAVKSAGNSRKALEKKLSSK